MNDKLYYDEDEYFEAVKVYEEAQAEASKIKNEVFSFKRGELPSRSITEKDIAIMDKAHEKWEKCSRLDAGLHFPRLLTF